MGSVSVDTAINDETKNILIGSSNILKSDIKGKIKSDFSDFYDLSLFNSQLDNISEAIDSLIECHESFISVISENKLQWEETNVEVAKEVENYNNNVSNAVNTGSKYSGKRNTGGGSGGGGKEKTEEPEVETINHGNPVKPIDVKTLVSKLTDETLCILIAKMYKMNKGDFAELLYNPEKSGILVALIRKVLNEAEIDDARTDETDEIQKELMEKLKINPEDITSDEEKANVEKIIVEKVKAKPDSEEKWDRLVYGEETKTVPYYGKEYIITKTPIDPTEYAKRTAHKISQDVDDDFKSACMSFSETHAADAYFGRISSAFRASGYNDSTKFYDFFGETKEETLAKVYEEIINGRPVVLQVNGTLEYDEDGNRKSNVRHFATVVGFKKGVSQSSIKEEDLLIIDSWDGKLETMDGEKSRFMTNGEETHKNYSGYRLRLIKT